VEQAVLFYDTDKWLGEHGTDPMHPTARQVRNREWFHMIGDHVFSMPDKWEYPWFAAWDLAFHTLALSTVDIDFAKEQLDFAASPSLPCGYRKSYPGWRRCRDGLSSLRDDRPSPST
jgi:hypothetical protein